MCKLNVLRAFASGRLDLRKAVATFKSHVRRDFFQAAAVLLPLQAARAEEALPSIPFVLMFFKPEEDFSQNLSLLLF